MMLIFCVLLMAAGPTACLSAQTTLRGTATLGDVMRFEGQEHKHIVDEVWSHFKSATKGGKKLEDILKEENPTSSTADILDKSVPEGIDYWAPFISGPGQKHEGGKAAKYKFSLGQVVAMAGDYYANEKREGMWSSNKPGVWQKDFCHQFTRFNAESQDTGPDEDKLTQPYTGAGKAISLNGNLLKIAEEGDLIDKELDIAKKLPNHDPSGRRYEQLTQKDETDMQKVMDGTFKDGDTKKTIGGEQAVYEETNGIPHQMWKWTSTFKHLINLATWNHDHFLSNSKTVFKRLNNVSTQLAKNYKDGGDSEISMAEICTSPTWKKLGKEQPLTRALKVLGFAMHFLTDMFAAGHNRTPDIRGMDEIECLHSTESKRGLNVKNMHDEDNFHGVEFTNAYKYKWRGYGDTKLLTTKGKATMAQAKNAVYAAISSFLQEAGFKFDDVTVGFDKKKFGEIYKDKMEPEKYIPIVDHTKQLAQPYTMPNRCPMYFLDTKTATTKSLGMLMVRDVAAKSSKHKQFFITLKKFADPKTVEVTRRQDFISKNLSKEKGCWMRQFKSAGFTDDCCSTPGGGDDGIYSCKDNTDKNTILIAAKKKAEHPKDQGDIDALEKLLIAT